MAYQAKAAKLNKFSLDFSFKFLLVFPIIVKKAY